MANPIAIVITDTNGKALTVTGTTTGGFITNPLPVTLTDVNGNALTLNSSGGGSVVVASGKTFTVNNTLTLVGTDAQTYTFPTTSATLARTDAANTFTGHQTIEGVTSTGATGTGKFVFDTSATLASPTFTGTATIATAAITTLSGTPNFSGSPTITGKLTTYNNQVTAGVGVPYVAAVIDTTGLQANVATVDLVPAAYVTANGRYRIEAYWVITTVGSVSSTLPSLVLTWTDGDNSAAQSITEASSNSSYGGAAITATTNTTATRGAFTTMINAKSGVAIQYATTAYASSAAGMTYALHIVATRLS